MTTSLYMDDVKVEIAFNAGYTTPAGSRTWTDVSDYVELKAMMPINRGRSNEMANADPNKLTLTLINRDGRFTPKRAASPYYPNVKIGRPIRVTATRPSGAPSVRFLGFIDEWPTEWDGTDATARAKITASSRLARLGLDTEMDNLLVTRYLDANPVQLYTLLNTRNGAVIYDSEPATLSYKSNGPPAALNAGISPEGEGTCALFAAYGGNGQYLIGQHGATASGPVVVAEAWISTTTDGTANGEFFTLTGLPVNLMLSADINDSARVAVLEFSGSTGVSGTTKINDGELHHVAGVYDMAGDELRFYIDGVLQGSAPCAGDDMASTGARIGAAFSGSVSFAMVSYDEAGIAERAGTAPMPASDMIELFATTQAIPAAELDLDSGTQNVLPFDTAGKSALDAMRVVEDTEGGVLFDTPAGLLAFRRRTARYGAASAFTLAASSQQIEADYTPVLDRSTLVNVATATSADGTVQTVTNAGSRDEYGPALKTMDIAGTVDDAFQAASWQLYLYAEPQPRVPSVTVDVLTLSNALRDAIAAADIGTRFTVSGLPSQAASSSVDYFIEGLTETFGPESHTVTFNVSPTTGYEVFVLNDAVRGVLDGPYPLAY